MKGQGQGCMTLLDLVFEGQLKERLMNAIGLNEPINLRPSVSFSSKNHNLTAIGFHHDTDSKFWWWSTRGFLKNLMLGMETRSTTGVQDN